MDSEDSDHISVAEEQEDWYNSSDTSDEIPDPNMSAEALYQDLNRLPEPIQNSFQRRTPLHND